MEAAPLTADALLRHEAFVLRLARSLVRNEASAEDIAQETLLSALEHRPHPAGLRSWLARVTRHRALDHLRGEQRRSDRELRAARSEAIETGPSAHERLELEHKVVSAVLALEEPYRSVVIAAYYEGLEPNEIARRRRVAPGTVRSQLSRAIEQLRAKLDREAGGEFQDWRPALVALLRVGEMKAHASALATAGTVVLSWKVIIAATAAAVAVSLIGWFILRPEPPTPVDTSGLPIGLVPAESAEDSESTSGSAAERRELIEAGTSEVPVTTGENEPLPTFVLEGRLEVGVAPARNIDWLASRFSVEGTGEYNIDLGWEVQQRVEKLGLFEVRATPIRRSSWRGGPRDGVLQAMSNSWAGLRLTVRHPLLSDASKVVEFPAWPWPEGVRTGTESEFRLDADRIVLDAATGVNGLVRLEDGAAGEHVVVGLFYFDADGVPSYVVDQSGPCDEEGRFFLHQNRPGPAIVLASAQGLKPGWKRVDILEGAVTDVGTLDLNGGVAVSGKVQRVGNRPVEEYEVEVDGFDPQLQNTRTSRWQSMLLLPTLEMFMWNGETMHRSRAKSPVLGDGSFSIGGLSEESYRVRVRIRADLVQTSLVATHNEVWEQAMAPSESLLLSPRTSSIRVRIVPKTGPRQKGTHGAIDFQYDLDRQRPERGRLSFLDETRFECPAHMPLDITLPSQPSGAVFRVVAPSVGEELTFEIPD
jgi:RNA polymerase sigma-70 factor, ECF subfamily